MGKFVIRETNTGIKFDLKAANGEVVATSEVYTTKNACLKGIGSVRKNAPAAHLEDLTIPDTPPAKNPKFEVYTDRSGYFRFRLKARNGEVIAISERYRQKAGCLNGVESVRKNAENSEIAEE